MLIPLENPGKKSNINKLYIWSGILGKFCFIMIFDSCLSIQTRAGVVVFSFNFKCRISNVLQFAFFFYDSTKKHRLKFLPFVQLITIQDLTP